MTERVLPQFIPPIASVPEADATPEETASACATSKPPRHDDPTRFGDWELSGKCVDF